MKIAVLFLSLTLASLIVRADDTVQVAWAYDQIGALSIFGSNGTTPLAGSAGGFILQLGYYTGATGSTSSTLFQGTWTALYGEGTANTSLFATAAMGSGITPVSGTDDRFNISGTVDTSIATTSTGIPTAGTIMAIRYYNANSLGSATYYGAASNPLWTWVSPTTPQPTNTQWNIADTGTVFQGAASEPETNIATSAVPEPATMSLMAGAIAIGVTGLLRRRKTGA
jgi:hypothetical protein